MPKFRTTVGMEKGDVVYFRQEGMKEDSWGHIAKVESPFELRVLAQGIHLLSVAVVDVTQLFK